MQILYIPFQISMNVLITMEDVITHASILLGTISVVADQGTL